MAIRQAILDFEKPQPIRQAILDYQPTPDVQDVPGIRPEIEQEPPTQPSFAEGVAFGGAAPMIREAFTGEKRTTPEIEAMPTIGELPEFEGISLAGLKAAFSTVTAGPKEAAFALQANFPDMQVRQDEKGNYIVKSAISGKDYAVNKPGLDPRDLMQMGLQTAIFAGGRGLGLAGRAALSAGKQAGIEATQQATGGEFDPETVAFAGAAEGVAPVAGAIGRGVKSVGSAVGKRGAGAAESALETVVGQAEGLGISPMTSDVRPPTTFQGKTGQVIGERIPFFGTGPVRSTQQKQRQKAVRIVLEEFGAEEVLPASDEVMSDLLKTRGKEIRKNVDLKKEVIERLSDNKKPVKVPKAVKVINEEVKTLSDLKFPGVKPIISLFENFKKALTGKKGQNLQNVELLRKQLGEELEDPTLAAVRSTGKKSVSKIYGALREDMGDFIKSQGELKDFTKWKVANKELSKLVNELDVGTLKSSLDKGTQTPEVIKKMLFSKKPSELRLLHKNLSPTGRKHAKVAMFQEVFEKMGGDIENISPEKFLTQMSKMGKSVDIFLNKEDKEVLKGLTKALSLTSRASVAGVKPATGAEMTLPVVASVISYMLGTKALPAVAISIAGISRVYESRAVRDLLLRLNRVPKGAEQDVLNKLTPLLQALRQKIQGEEK